LHAESKHSDWKEYSNVSVGNNHNKHQGVTKKQEASILAIRKSQGRKNQAKARKWKKEGT
jgi:hypothetical protein